MIVILTEQFDQAYEKLAKSERKSVQKALSQLAGNPRHSGLHVKKVEGEKNIWEARPSKRLRMTSQMDGETITLRNVGEHDKVLKKP